MLVILNVNKKNQFSNYNGHTFAVKDFLSNGFGLLGIGANIGTSNQIDFTFSEVIVVNLTDELKKASGKTLDYLLRYVTINKININFIQK